jgi:hypothetical protein
MGMEYRSLLDAFFFTAGKLGKSLREILAEGVSHNDFILIFEAYLCYVAKEEITFEKAKQMWARLIDVSISPLILSVINQNRYTFPLSKVSLPMYVDQNSRQIPPFFKRLRGHAKPSTRLA